MKNITSEQSAGNSLRAGLVLGALGVVFGDIGTSPLYALRECFTGIHALEVNQANVYGSVSLVFLLLVLVVCVKYVIIMMHADNKGEGGIMALTALVERIRSKGPGKSMLIPVLGIVGAALLFSDGIITPAVSVLCALEGLTVRAPGIQPMIVPLSVAVLLGLFMLQPLGTSRIGGLFGPIIIIWLATIGILGAIAIFKHPQILAAINPVYGIQLLTSHPTHILGIISTVFLAVTGAEVLYADMGHFGKTPIRFAWSAIVFPALLLNYMGQGAYLLSPGSTPDNLFFRLAPDWFLIPLVCIATAATIIASQAVISGAFSLARQAVQLGFWPRLRIIHTSPDTIGQVYIPFVNMALLAGTVFLIFTFKESTRLAGAYGIAVSATMLITTILALMIAKNLWRVPFVIIFVVGIFFLILHTSLFIANCAKLPYGGWFVVLISYIISFLMLNWLRGRLRLRKRIESESVPLVNFVEGMIKHKTVRVKGTAVFLSANIGAAPRALLHNFKHNKVVHERTLLVAIRTQEYPYVKESERIEINELGEGIAQIVLKYGFMEAPNLPRELMANHILSLDPMNVTYFLGKESLALSKGGSVPLWSKQVFMFLANNSLNAPDYYGLPPNRVVELGGQVEL